MKHWQLEIAEEIATLTLDVAGASANTLSQEVLHELDEQLRAIESQSLQGLVIRSAKPGGFIAGADVREFTRLSDPARAAELARAAQHVFDRLARLPFPSVAAIHGYCLGGGLELALACTYRVARDDPSTRLGLPEVRLGIHPGFGGTVRLPPLVGDLAALDMMLTGRALRAKEAQRLGLVDEAVPQRHLLRAARARLRERPRPHRSPWYRRVPLRWRWLRRALAKWLARRVREKAHPDHYPAPYRLLELWERRAGEEQEAISIGELLVSRTSRNLVHVFLLGEALKRQGRRRTHEIAHLHVVGAGVMGADIAMWAASHGFSVSLQDKSHAALARALARAHEFFHKQLREPRAVQAALDRLMPDLAGDGLRRADLVIEAIVEQTEAKQQLLRAIEPKLRPQAIIATNTSSIPLETLAQALADPTRLVGLHFFNPVAKMQLVEVVRGEKSGEPALARARAWCVAIEKLPLDVKSSPGFLVNRVLMPYLVEAVKMVEEGVPIERIDRAARDFGMPMGPIELADTVGLDICLAVARILAGALGIEVPERLVEMVEQGKLGKKSGAGFYTYDARGRIRRRGGGGDARAAPAEVPVTERLILRLLNEAMACLREGVVADADAVDAGMVYGTGFAPFLGGPMRYAESLGETGISHSLYRLAQEYGPRFEPDPGWSQPGLLARRTLTE